MTRQPYVDPRTKTIWPHTTDGWAARRALFLANAYKGENLPTAGADGIDRSYGGIALTPNMDRIDRYRFDNCGGRPGSPMRGFLISPKVPATEGVLHLFVCGHDMGWDTRYNDPAGIVTASTIQRALNAGHHVVACDLLGFGNNPIPEVITVNGAPTTFSVPPFLSLHDLQSLDADGGPTAFRAFTDHLVRSLTQAIADTGITRVWAAGHSGGGVLMSMWGIVDGRAQAVYSLQGGLPERAWDYTYGGSGIPYGCGVSDWEQCWQNPQFRWHGGSDFGTMITLAASFPGRRCVLCADTSDTTFHLRSPAALSAWADEAKFHVNSSGGQLDYRLGIAERDHEISHAEADFVTADAISWLERAA